MTPDENIFDANACLTRSQVQDYLSAAMATEEIEAVERHFSSCPLCREAMDGYLAHAGNALETLASLNTHFIKEQVGNIQQQHPAKPVPVLTRPARRKRSLGRPPGFTSLVQVVLIGSLFILFQNELNKPVPRRALTHTSRAAAQAETVVTKGLAEVKTEPAPPPKKYPEAPVGRNLKLQGTVNVVVPTNSDTGHAVVAAKLLTQPVVIQVVPTVVQSVAARPGGTGSVTATGITPVATGSATATTRPSTVRSVTAVPSTGAEPGQQGVQRRSFTVGSNGEIEEPDLVNTPKSTSKPIGPPVDAPPAQPAKKKAGSPIGSEKSKTDNNWLWE